MNQPSFYDICKRDNIDTKLFNNVKLDRILFDCVLDILQVPYLLHYINKDNAVYTDLKLWFYFDKIWIVETKAKKRYFEDYVRNLEEKYAIMYNLLKNTELKQYCKDVNKIIKNLCELKSRTKIKNMCKELFYKPNDDFLDKLDINTNLLAFTNGVYDLELKDFRPFKYDDNICLTTEYDYDPNPLYVDEVTKVINQILPNEDERNYLLKVFACCLFGKPTKKMTCFYRNNTKFRNQGGNGKTTITTLLYYTLGEYMNHLSNLFMSLGNYIIQEGMNRKIHKKYGEYARGRRAMHYGEIFKPMCSEKRIQELTSRENLLEECKFNMFIESNKPIINNECKIINFTVEFVEDGKIVNPDFEVLYDRSVKENCRKKWRMSFMKILLDYWDLYELEGLE